MAERSGRGANSPGGQPEGVSHGRPESLRAWQARQPPEVLAQALKERVYATFTGLAIVLVLRTHEGSPQDATYSLAISILGITVAGFAADVIAHLAQHGTFPDREELGRMLRIAGGALASASLPILLLLLTWPGWISLEGALLASTIIYVATLGLIGFIAVRRTTLTWWAQLLALLALALLGAIVVGLQLLAHSA